MPLPILADWKAPWELDLDADGKPQFDLDKAKRYQYGLLTDKEKLQTDITKLAGEKVTLQTQVDAATRKGETDIDKLVRENAELKAATEAAGKDSAEVLKLRVALDKGLSAIQAKRLVGNTVEELTTDADDLLASFGGSGAGEDEENDNGKPSGRPRRNLRNNADPNPDGDKDFDPEAIVGRIYSGNLF